MFELLVCLVVLLNVVGVKISEFFLDDIVVYCVVVLEDFDFYIGVDCDFIVVVGVGVQGVVLGVLFVMFKLFCVFVDVGCFGDVVVIIVVQVVVDDVVVFIGGDMVCMKEVYCVFDVVDMYCWMVIVELSDVEWVVVVQVVIVYC